MKRQENAFLILASLFFLNILAWLAVYDLSQPKFLEITFFDVGQGDAIFIETPDGNQILIDGGPGKNILEKLSQEMPFWDRTIDFIILTHPEHDHYGGLIDVLKRYNIENILWSGVLRDAKEYKEWQKLVDKEEAEIIIAKSGQKIIGDFGFEMEVLHPFESFKEKNVKNTNNTSVITRLVFGEKSFLFTGDAYKVVEKELIAQGIEIDSDVLKVGHHGSKTSTDEDFIKKVSPEIAVISVGKNNSYGHPHSETLEILEKYDISIFRTDELGNIKIICDSQSLKLK